MNVAERASVFACGSERLVGIFSEPEQPAARGLLIAVGGPQYRAGSHRQFVLMARAFAAAGMPVLRFDYRGMGDSGGAPRQFDQVGDDIAAAVGHFFEQIPRARELILLGLCDGACAIALQAGADPRVRGIVMLNPWVRSVAGAARTTLRHYYLGRLGQLDFWGKLARGALCWRAALGALGRLLADARAPAAPAPIAQRMLERLQRFDGRLLIVLSGDDLTAQEFAGLAARAPGWRALLAGAHCSRADLADADHTFSCRRWREQVCARVLDWSATW